MRRPMSTQRRRAGIPYGAGRALSCVALAILVACGPSPSEEEGPEGPVDAPVQELDPLVEIREHELEPGERIESLATAFEDGSPMLTREVIRNEDGIVNHGRFRRWHANGQLAEEGHYLRGAKHGTYTVIADSGMKTTEIDYRRGKRNGQYLKWGPRGVLKERSHYREDVLHGSFEQWSGLTRAVMGQYEQGVQTGTWTTWHPLETEVKSSEGEYRQGLKHGVWKTWDEEGRLLSEETYSEGEWDGPYVEYGEGGEPVVQRTYSRGRPEGVQIEWYPDGAKKSQSVYVDGRLDGPQEQWYPSGQKRAEGLLKDGKRVGRWVYYNADGTVNESWTGTYDNDERISA